MKNNKPTTEKKTLKKQLISGGVYIALSAVAVAVTVNTAVSMLSGKENLPPVSEKLSETVPSLPSVPENLMFPQNSLPEISGSDLTPDIDVTVSDSPSGISAEVTENTAVGKDSTASENLSETDSGFDITEISSNANLGQDSFIKPCDGFVTVEHSLDIPVYSATLGDYRTHSGVDIAADAGAIVKAVKGGVITEIYTDDLYGNCLKLKTPDGYTFIYSNLTEALSEGIQEGVAVSTGTVLGCVGSSAILEASQESHLHFEVEKDGEAVNPEDIISF